MTSDDHHSERFVYPELLPISDNMTVESKDYPGEMTSIAMPLRRESLILDRNGMYILDAMNEIYIYRLVAMCVCVVVTLSISFI
jgi:hypothetical protein